MKVIRDYYCTECRNEVRDIIGDVTHVLPCDECRCATEHRDMCNGARHSRFHFNDFGTVPYEAMATYDGAGASEASDGQGGADLSRPVTDTKTGEAIQNRSKYLADARAERAARAKYTRAKRAGLGRVYAPTSGAKKASNGN